MTACLTSGERRMKKGSKETMRIHVVPGVDSRAAARDLLETGAVGIDDIGESLQDIIHDEILEELGHAGDALDLRTQRVDTALGPVFVLRNADVWSAAEARKALLDDRGPP